MRSDFLEPGGDEVHLVGRDMDGLEEEPALIGVVVPWLDRRRRFLQEERYLRGVEADFFAVDDELDAVDRLTHQILFD